MITGENFLLSEDLRTCSYFYFSSKNYPVIYFNDGQCIFWPGGLAGKSWKVLRYRYLLYDI